MGQTYAEIRAKIEELEKQADEAKRRETKEIVDTIKKQIALYNLTAEDLGLASPPASKGKSKSQKTVMYRNGNLTWSGSPRGRKPKWINDLQEQGQDIEKFRVA